MKILAYIIIALIIFVMVAFFVMGKKSQSGQAIGVFGGQLAPCGSRPNCVSSEEGRDAKKMVKPFTGDWDALVKAIQSVPGAKVTKNENGYLSAEFKSKIFGFVDDFEARQDADMIQVRSTSRVGYSDRGVNKHRVEALRKKMAATHD